MTKIRYKIYCEGEDETFIKIKPTLTQKEVVYSIKRKSSKERPVQFYTGTTDMKDWIGNVREIVERNDETFLSVEGIYRGKNQTLRNIKSRDSNIKKIGDRVMVTEHLNVAGSFDMLATKRRIMDNKKSELNFINIGWSTDEICRYLRTDPYTGETKECIGGPI